MTLTEYRTALTNVETAIANLIATGQKYAVVGSHSNERASLSDLRELQKFYRAKILRLSGYRTGRTKPDFSV